MTRRLTATRTLLWLWMLAAVIACQTRPADSKSPSTTPSPVEEFSQAQLDRYIGKTVVLNFWAIWCAPCRSEMPALEASYNEYRDQGLVVIAVNVSESSDTVLEFAQSRSLTFPMFWDRDQQWMRAFEVRSLPTTFFIDHNGTIVSRHIGAMTANYIKDRVEPLLQ